MKECIYCKQCKSYEEFYKSSTNRDGFIGACKPCRKARSAAYYEKRSEHIKNRVKLYNAAKPKKPKVKKPTVTGLDRNDPKYMELYYQMNREKWVYVSSEKVKTRAKEYSHKYKKRLEKYRKKYYAKNKETMNKRSTTWKKLNKSMVNATNAHRRAKKLNATLGNYKETINLIYKTVEGLTHVYDIDHIIPLIHPDVCGLHVPWNLQIITNKENATKGNKFDGTTSNESWRTI